MKAMETVQDLIEEFKIRTVYWALCVFAVCYFLTHTSKSMWMNIPISILFVSVLRILFNEVEFHWKVRKIRQQTYLSILEKKQLSVNDSRLSTLPPPPKWKKKIDAPVVEASMEEFVNKLLQDFVTDLWYSDITPDKEAPELMHGIIMDVLAEISGRVKEINLVDLLTRDVVDLVGDHLDLFRRNQAAIGVEVMGTLSSEERDERLKHHLTVSKELHPALISPECEYKVLQRIVGGLLAVVLRPREAQCPLVRCIARELVTCMVMQPIMNFASPMYINELIEYIFLAIKDDGSKAAGDDQPPNVGDHNSDHSVAAEIIPNEFSSRRNASSYNQGTNLAMPEAGNLKGISLDASENLDSNIHGEETMQPRPPDWARVIEAATLRRTEVLMPENLENMWARGRNYRKKVQKSAGGLQAPVSKGSGLNNVKRTKSSGNKISNHRLEISSATEDKALVKLPPRSSTETRLSEGNNNLMHISHGLNMHHSIGGASLVDGLEGTASNITSGIKCVLKRSNSTSALKEPNMGNSITSEGSGPIISEFYSSDFDKHNDVHAVKSASDTVFRSEGSHTSKLRGRVIGAYFEKLGSNSFAVYSIAVTDADKNTWFVKRRYRNFERLHRHLKDIPNYTLHLPPKRIFSSSTEDAFVHQRCIQLDKYLQDLLSIANVAEQHEVWDFLSVSSKNYSFGKSSSVMRSLAVSVDDAVDDIVRQFKGVSDGLMRKVAGSSSSPHEASPETSGRNLSWNADEISRHLSWQTTTESAKSISDEEGDKDGTRGHEEVGSSVQANGWHSDNELSSKSFPPRVVKRGDEFRSLNSEKKHGLETEPLSLSVGGYPPAGFPVTSDHLDYPAGVLPEWTPPNLSIPVLNLVDNIFQLKRRGWLRRQVFWISKQILQLMMEDAIDDWLLRQIQWLRRDDVIALGIRWVQDVLWPDGTFFLRLRTQSENDAPQPNQRSFQTTNRSSNVSIPGSFEQRLEAARRASDVKKMIFRPLAASASIQGHLPLNKINHPVPRVVVCKFQSTVCLKQLAYGILELVLISVFPELRDVVLDIHEKMRAQPV
ncbi:hypothetical protein RHGRI_013676 [Rhododendron griersonianum]|uniref:Phox-associated domain-containing protein n=1 Tax=Rhododendron griersonianum TaxID=479676 RepID=A0AAV6K6U5_9ERIC|nr:hypothetical protein RHGRI_013676 [Rhododendron griersonianum]